MSIYKRFESGDVRVTIFQDEAVDHPFAYGSMYCSLACWTENEYFGSFLPGIHQATCLKSIEALERWKQAHPNHIVVPLVWWGKCNSDVAFLEQQENIPLEEADGAIFIDSTPNRSRDDPRTILNQELNQLNAYLGGNVYAYTIETRKPFTQEQYTKLVNLFRRANNYKMDYAPLFEKVSAVLKLDDWTVVKSSGGYFHSSCKDTGDKEMYEDMFGNTDMTEDMKQIYQDMMMEE